MGKWEGTNVSIVLCSLRRAKHQVTTTKWLLRSTGDLETRMTTIAWVLQRTPVDIRGQTTRRWTRLLDSHLHFNSNKLWHTERVKLPTFLCQCFFPRWHYFTRHETHSSEAAKAVRFARNTTMAILPIILHFFLIYLQLFLKIIQPVKWVSGLVSVKIRQI